MCNNEVSIFYTYWMKKTNVMIRKLELMLYHLCELRINTIIIAPGIIYTLVVKLMLYFCS